MVHKLRNRDVCHTSPRPDQSQSKLFRTKQRNVAHSTPKPSGRRQPHIHSQLNRRQDTMLEDVSNVLSTVTFSQMQEPVYNEQFTAFGDLNQSKYELKLHQMVDEYIFSHTFKKRKGVSLYAIKKSIKEENSSYRFSKGVSRYIAFCIGTGKLQQITGHGASGTFRLNRTIHKKYVRRFGKLRKVSSQSHIIQKRANKQQALRNTIA